MQDLLLFEILRDEAHDDPRLPKLLEELSEIAPRARIPYFGWLLDLVTGGAKAELRVPALRALEGADHPLALEAALSALDAPETFDAALVVLRSAASRRPARLAHLLFHPRADVRKATLERCAPSPLEFHLLADPETRATVIERGAMRSAPEGAISAVLDLHARGILSRTDARRMIAERAQELPTWARGVRARTAEIVGAYITSAKRVEGPDEVILEGSPDDLDALLEVIWDDPPSGFFMGFGRYARGQDSELRFAVAIISRARKTGAWPAGASGALAAALPEALVLPWIDDARRAAMLRELYADPARREAAELAPLAKAPFVTRADGTIDLSAVGAVLQMASSAPYAALFEWFTPEQIDAALTAHPIENAPILWLWDDKGRKRVVEIAPRSTRKALLATLARRAPNATLPFLIEIDGDEQGLLAPVTGRGWSELFVELLNEPIDDERAERLADLGGTRMNASAFEAVIAAWLARPGAPGASVGRAVMIKSAQILDVPQWIAIAKRTGKDLMVLLGIIARTPTFAWAKEKALALELRDHPAPEVRAWAEERAPLVERVVAEPIAEHVDVSALAAAPEGKLEKLLAPFHRGDRAGLAPALAARAASPSVPITVALLGSNDALEETARELARFASDDDAFRASLDVAMVAAYAYRDAALSPFGHAVLWRWDAHGKRFFKSWLRAHGDLAKAVRAAFDVKIPWLREETARAMTNAFALYAARALDRLASLVNEDVAGALADSLSGDAGLGAAQALALVHKVPRLRHAALAVLPRVREMLPDLDEAVRDAIASWIDAEGLPERAPPRPPEPELDEVTVARIKGTTDLDELARLAKSERVRVVHEATLRLIEIGEHGQVKLLEILARTSPEEVARRVPIVESVSLWSEGESLRWMKVFSDDPARPPELAFRVAISLAERGEDASSAIVRAVTAPSETRWFTRNDWLRAKKHVDVLTLARAFAVATHPHAHLPAVEHVLESDATSEGDAALMAFLDCGTRRMGSLRRRAALRLWKNGHGRVYPLVLEQLVDEKNDTPRPWSPRLADLAVRSIVLAAPNTAKEPFAIDALAEAPPRSLEAQDLWAWLAEHATVDQVRAKAIAAIGRGPMRARRVRAIAEAFSWGQDRSRELTGRVFRVQMTGGRGLGYTRFRENKVFVSPMPILRGDRFGEDVVRGLVLHELGHHMYHRGAEREKVWEQAQKEGIHGLLNLVADEHLERNVRAIDQEYGDLLKRLASFAFQHSEREIPLAALLQILQGRAFEVLSGAKLGVSRDPESVKVASGALLRTMERAELPFARFVRALRMGLGNRSNDPMVEAGLELFRERFRKGEMQSLLDVARRLRAIFGWQARIVEHFGTHESLEEGEGDGSEWGISDEEIEREVERVREPRERRDDASGKPGGRAWLNVEPKAHFDKITIVKKMPFDAAAHAPYAKRVERSARLLRRYLEELGLGLVPVRQRLVGHRLDTTRLRALVLRGDPRVLVARTKDVAADVFLGIVIDCSGSMASRGNMERAKHFAVLLAEAAATLRGVDVRVFGFTDQIIFDCGDARRCAAHALQACGGNNDAAALWHAASVAKASLRRAKVLVMISDGLPTECSVDALRHLVELLTKREKMVCAQIAVQPIAEICFPHYVVVNDDNQDTAVQRFGEIVLRLVRGALAA